MSNLGSEGLIEPGVGRGPHSQQYWPKRIVPCPWYPFIHLSSPSTDYKRPLMCLSLASLPQTMFTKLLLCAACHARSWKLPGPQILLGLYFLTLRELRPIPWGPSELVCMQSPYPQGWRGIRISPPRQRSHTNPGSHIEIVWVSWTLLINRLPVFSFFFFLLATYL